MSYESATNNKSDVTIDQLVNFQTFQKIMRKLFMIDFMNTAVINFFLINADFTYNREI